MQSQREILGNCNGLGKFECEEIFSALEKRDDGFYCQSGLRLRAAPKEWKEASLDEILAYYAEHNMTAMTFKDVANG